MRQIAYILSLGLGLCLSVAAYASEPPTLSTSKADTVRYLRDLRTQNVARLQEIDRTLGERIKSSDSASFENEISPLRSARREHLLRQEFLDRLILQVDRHFAGGDLRAFLERTLPSMATADAMGTAESSLMKFLKFAADAVHRLPEQRENILSFLEGYMNRSVSDPISPDDYLKSRNYTNGSESESGSPLAREQAGAVAEKRLEELRARTSDYESEVH